MSILKGIISTARIRLIATAAQLLLVGLSACSDDRQTPDAETGRIMVAIARAEEDVAAVALKVVNASDGCSGPAVASTTEPIEGNQGGGTHAFSEHVFVIAPGEYRICASPLTADGSPSARCAPANASAMVVARATTVVNIASSCLVPDSNGAIETTVTLNHAPSITGLSIFPDSTISRCNPAEFAVTATDPDGDPMIALWLVLGPVGSVVPFITPTGFVARFTPDVPGDYQILVRVADSFGAETTLIFPVTVTSDACTPPRPTQPVTIEGTLVGRMIARGGTLTMPSVGNEPADIIDVLARIVTVGSGATAQSRLQFCHIFAASTNVSMDVDPSVLGLLAVEGPSVQQTVAFGDPVSLPGFSTTIGQNADGSQVDADHDGLPGVSIHTVLARPEILFSSLVINLGFSNMTLVGQTAISGQASFSLEGNLFGGAPLSLVGPLGVATATPTTPMPMSLLPGDVDCGLLEMLF